MAETEGQELKAETVDALKTKWPSPRYRLQQITRNGQLLVVRNATQGEWDQFQDDQRTSQSLNVIYGRCIVFPPPAELQQFFERYPAAKTGQHAIINVIQKLSGAAMEADSPKDL
jgi:hypothetical protein